MEIHGEPIGSGDISGQHAQHPDSNGIGHLCSDVGDVITPRGHKEWNTFLIVHALKNKKEF